MDSPEKKLPVPPYVAFKTFKNFLERFKAGIPGRIDKGLMSSMSGAAQSQVITTLRYLGFIDESSVPTRLMRTFIGGDEDLRSEILKTVIRESYPFIFGDTARFAFESATGSQLREEFEERTAASGETVFRCIAFLRDAASEAGIPISPYLSNSNAKVVGSKRRAIQNRSKEGKKIDGGMARNAEIMPEQVAAQKSLLLWGLVRRLPEPGSTWQKWEREKWIETLVNVFDLEYREG